MPRFKPTSPIKLWIIQDQDGKPLATPNGTWFDTQREAEETAKELGKSKRAVVPYGRIDPKPRGNLGAAAAYRNGGR
jgi:hypothetical protein